MWLCFRETTAPSSLHDGLQRQLAIERSRIANYPRIQELAFMVAGVTERDWARTIWLIYTCSQAADRQYPMHFLLSIRARGTGYCSISHVNQDQISLELPCRSTVLPGLLLDLQCFMQSCKAAEVCLGDEKRQAFYACYP